jgi:hypothetical protein
MKNSKPRKKTNRKKKEKFKLGKGWIIISYSMMKERKRVMGEIGILYLFYFYSIQRLEE